MEFKATDNHNYLYDFYCENSLEVSRDISIEDNAIFSLKYEDESGVLAAATLSKRKSNFILDYVAVADALRGKGIGKKLVLEMLNNAKIMGAKEVFISAKNHNFFKALGFIEGEPENLDLNNDCKGCPQFLNGCNPVKMKIDI